MTPIRQFWTFAGGHLRHSAKLFTAYMSRWCEIREVEDAGAKAADM
jgi:hypothetical protein